MKTEGGNDPHKFDEPEIRGDLPKRKYDIYCQMIQGPDYKNNYYLESCRLRIADQSCKNERCVNHGT